MARTQSDPQTEREYSSDQDDRAPRVPEWTCEIDSKVLCRSTAKRCLREKEEEGVRAQCAQERETPKEIDESMKRTRRGDKERELNCLSFFAVLRRIECIQ